MASKRRRSSTKTITVRERVQPAPIRISVPRSGPIKKHRRRRSHSGGGRSRSVLGGNTGGMSLNKSGALALGGFLYGFIEKNFGAQIPSIPVVGKTGAIALGAYWLGGRNGGIVADIGNAASVIMGYSFGSTGKVSGMLAPQVSGIAAQV